MAGLCLGIVGYGARREEWQAVRGADDARVETETEELKRMQKTASRKFATTMTENPGLNAT